MNISTGAFFKDVLLETKDGDWGHGEPAKGLLPYHVIRATDFASTSLGDVGNVPLRYLPDHTVQRRTLQLNDILIETAGGSPSRPTGRTMLMTQRAMDAFDGAITCASFARFLRVDPQKVDPRYLYWFLQALYQSGEIEQYQVQHTGVARFQYTQFASTQKVPLPDEFTQRAIAEVLGALDDKIAANTKLAATAEALGKALFQNAISGPEAISVELRDVAKNVAGKYLAKDEYVSDGPYFIYGSNSIMGRHNKALTQGGFAVLAKIGSYCGNLRWSQRPAWVNNNASAIFPSIGTAPSVLRHALDLIDMAPHKAGTGQPYIRMESLFSSEITVPSLETSAAIAPLLDDLSELEARSGEENLTLAATRDTLLPQLMSGKLRVKDAEKVLEGIGV